ncbi:hypothetical protein X798_00945, partial [Onchocerca flexuosa]
MLAVERDNAMCIYGIKFTGGFDDVLYYNDPIKHKNIAELLDKAGMNLCNSALAGTDVDLFQEVSIPITDKNYIDLFITCCSVCPYDNAMDWRIHLKSQFLIHHYAIIKTSKNLYEMAPRVSAIPAPCICITEIYREVPGTGNNDVCFTHGQQKFVNPIAGEKYPLELETLLRMGYYNSTAAEYPLGYHCTMKFNSWIEDVSKEDSCLFGLNRTDFKYFCCCYGSEFRGCQELSANLLRKDIYLKDQLFCAMEELVIEKNKFKEENKLTTFVVPIETMIKVINESSRNMACHMRLINNDTINFEGDENLCIQSAALDIRLRPIITTVCISLK